MNTTLQRLPPLHLSFSGCGFLIPFHLGVASYLKTVPPEQKLYRQLTKDSRFAGASGGAIVAAGLAGKMSIDLLMHLALELASTCRQHGTGWKLDQVLTRALNENITTDIYDTIQHHREGLTIAMTRVSFPQVKVAHVSTFHSREDLIQALRTSCYLPGYSARRPLLLSFRNARQCDGGLVQLVPQVSSEYEKVCVFPAYRVFQHYDISPSIMGGTFPYSIPQLAVAALQPPSEDMLMHLFELGQQSAALWVQGKK